jgi:hypothetical protein
LIDELDAGRQIRQQVLEHILVCRNRSWPTETTVMQIILDGTLDSDTIDVCGVRYVVNGQPEFSRLPCQGSAFGRFSCIGFSVVFLPLVFIRGVANTDVKGAILGRLRAAPNSQCGVAPAPISPVSVIDSCDGHV